MLVLLYRYWCPLSGCDLEIVLSNKVGSAELGSVANICCFRVARDGDVENIKLGGRGLKTASTQGGLTEGALIALGSISSEPQPTEQMPPILEVAEENCTASPKMRYEWDSTDYEATPSPHYRRQTPLTSSVPFNL